MTPKTKPMAGAYTLMPFLGKHLLIVSEQTEHNPRLIYLDWIELDGVQDFDLTNLITTSPKTLKKIFTTQTSNFDKIHPIPPKNNNLTPAQALILTSVKQLTQYAQGQRQNFDLPLNFDWATPFQKSVWYALQQIPYGKTLSYAQLAQKINHPTAHRAVANANGKNPFSIVIPCHRVIASDGKLGGYTGGIDKKIALLTLEGVLS